MLTNEEPDAGEHWSGRGNQSIAVCQAITQSSNQRTRWRALEWTISIRGAVICSSAGVIYSSESEIGSSREMQLSKEDERLRKGDWRFGKGSDSTEAITRANFQWQLPLGEGSN